MMATHRSRSDAKCWIGLRALAMTAFALAFDCASAGGIGPWVGEYKGPDATLKLERNGRFTWELIMVPGGGDAGLALRAAGRADVVNAKTLRLTFARTSFSSSHTGPLPEGFVAPTVLTFDLATVDQRRFLLDERAVLYLLNMVNSNEPGATIGQDELMMRTEPTASVPEPRKTFNALALVPRRYRSRLLETPRSGRIVSVGTVTDTRDFVGGWMQPRTPVVRHSARLTFDIGSAQGAFVGMQVFVGPQQSSAFIDRIDGQQSQAIVSWLTDGPAVGMTVSTAFRRQDPMPRAPR